MKCTVCHKRHHCRVPQELNRFDRVSHRLEEEHRNPLLRQKLDFYYHAECLVDAGIVDP